MDPWSVSPDRLLVALSAAGLRRGWLVTEVATGRVRASHELLEPLARAVGADDRDYRGHHAVFLEVGS